MASHIGHAHVAFDYFHGLRSCDMPISWLNHKPHAIAVYASWPALPSTHATLATGRPATALLGPVLHRLGCTGFRWRLQKVGLGHRHISLTWKRGEPILCVCGTCGCRLFI